MALFRRSRSEQSEQPEDAVEAAAVQQEPAGVPAPPRPQGPWDVADAPEDGVQRLDLGGLRVPVPPQTEVRVEVGPEGQVVAATLVRAGSAMQVSAFAAPRTEGIWFEVREEIAESLRSGGGTATEVDGTWGVELQATVPTEVPGGGRQLLPARFVGVDGPRWFLRAMLTGPAAIDSASAEELRAALRDVVVVRGTDPMAVRDPLPLRLPKDVQEAAEAATRPAAPQVPERGPEITEVR
jgi:hypothetical protein